jgi:hypothetical protein
MPSGVYKRKPPSKHIQVSVYEGSDHWLIKFPDREIIARDRGMARRLVAGYAKNHNVIASISWVTL